ncbi:MAG: SusD-like 3 [Bacteroidetes bacterium]|nr:SusD-like 3 [Bacteroidota bacterium]
MKKIINILSAAALSLILWSCSESIMDEINKNINDPSDMASRLIITDAMTGSAFSVTGGDFGFYASIYIEHNAGVWGQFYNADIRSSQPTSSTEGGVEEGNYHTLGIAQILTAYNLAVLTDVMGDVPWTEALQPGVIFTPVLDKQEDIYKDILQLLDDAIINLGKETIYSSLGGQDLTPSSAASDVYKRQLLWCKLKPSQ